MSISERIKDDSLFINSSDMGELFSQSDKLNTQDMKNLEITFGQEDEDESCLISLDEMESVVLS